MLFAPEYHGSSSKTSATKSDRRESGFLFEKLSVAIRRFNAVCVCQARCRCRVTTGLVIYISIIYCGFAIVSIIMYQSFDMFSA